MTQKRGKRGKRGNPVGFGSPKLRQAPKNYDFEILVKMPGDRSKQVIGRQYAKNQQDAIRKFRAQGGQNIKGLSARKLNPGKPGSAFKRCVESVSAKGKAYSPRGVCATAGRKKYGKKQFQAMAAAGRRRAAASKKNVGKRKSARRHNPEEAAAERYEFFHGREPGEVIDVETPVHRHGVVSGIGRLVSLSILSQDGKNVVTLGFGKDTYLSQNEAGTQLLIVGGDQSVKLADFGITRAHENEVLGAAVLVVYHTRKDHLRPEDGGTADYEHKFGPTPPLVIYDVRNKLLHFAGGRYTLPEVGIRG